MKKEERIAIVPGSFDPITNGHISIIEKAAQAYDKVYVAVMINAQKKYMFSLEQREDIVKACFAERDNIAVISSDGWLWELAKALGACAIVKGYRNDVDLEYERKMAEFNEERYPDAKTVLIKAEKGLTDISSTLVREYISQGKSLDELMPKAAIAAMKSIK